MNNFRDTSLHVFTYDKEEIIRLRLMRLPTPFLRLLYVLVKQVLDRRGEQ